MRSEDFRCGVYRNLLARAAIARVLLLAWAIFFTQQGAALAQSARRDDAGPQNFLVLGVGTAKAAALDPSNPDNVLRFRNDFRDILAISYSDLADRSQSGGPIQLGADLGDPGEVVDRARVRRARARDDREQAVGVRALERR